MAKEDFEDLKKVLKKSSIATKLILGAGFVAAALVVQLLPWCFENDSFAGYILVCFAIYAIGAALAAHLRKLRDRL